MSARDSASSRIRSTAASVTLALVTFAACGSSGKSATQKVCDARSNLRSAVATVQSDVQSGNFGEAKNGLSKVQTSFDQLQQDLKDLKTDEQQALQPQVDAIATNVSNLNNATSLSEVQSDLNTIGSQLQSLYNDVTNKLKCS
jgi:phosphoglycerate-specific signal transduction histidine kinase